MADFAQVWQEICVRAQTDEEFKRDLMADANEILKSKGFEAPAGFKFKVIENSPATVMHLVLPAKEEEIDQVAPAGNETISQYHASVV
ncbi:MAG: NHLP leader peptide family RiPP precursor [Actinomycetota bacterium]|nr:NHLP leader peptide family RiPP precursor [Actinomycetota bacterium]